MALLDQLLAKIGLTRKGIGSSTGGSVADPFALWRSGRKVAADKAFDVYAGWVYACIRAIAEEIGSMHLKLFKISNDGTHEEQFEHELIDILEAVNLFQTGLELKYTTAAHLELVGNAYWFLEGVSSPTDKPRAIYALNPSRVRVVADRNLFPASVQRYQYRTQTNLYEFAPFQIVHLKYPDPSDPFEGIGTVQSLAQWIDADNYAMEFNRRFFLNGARLGGFLESEAGYTTEQLEYLKRSFENIFKGVENAYKVAALPKGTTFKPASETQKDMDFANMMEMMRNRILAGFRVPRTVLGITDDVNRANAEATNYVFALRTIKPKMRLIVSYLNEFLVSRYGDNLYLDFEDPVPENRELRIQEMQAAVADQPVMSVNEAREEYFGFEGVEGGDTVNRPFSFLAAGKTKPRPQRRPAHQHPFSRATRNARLRKSISLNMAHAVTAELKRMKATIEQIRQKDVTTLTDSEFEVVWKGFVTRVTPYENLVIEKIKQFNAEQKAEVLKLFAERYKINFENLENLLGVDKEKLREWVGVLVNLAEPVYTELLEKEGQAAGELLGIAGLDILTPEVLKALRRSLELMGRSYNQTTLAALEERLTQGIKEGLGFEELIGRIQEVYEFSDAVRAGQVARTETFRVANEATKEAWKQTGIVKTVKWYTAADERVCPWCEPMHGKTAGIEENFFDQGDTVTGSDRQELELEYDDIGHPPLHVNCRCYLRPDSVSND